MTAVAVDQPEDPRVVATEVGAHLLEILGRAISDPLRLAQAWSEVHLCDDALVHSLDPPHRAAYLTIIDSPVRQHRPRASGRPIIEDRAVRLRLALRRRLMVLDEFVDA